MPYDAGSVSGSGESCGKKVIDTPAVYPRFFEFLHVDIKSTGPGHTLSRPWSRQPNDVMSEIVCAQLHNELLGRRHNALQSHSLFALAKHLFKPASGFVFCAMSSVVDRLLARVIHNALANKKQSFLGSTQAFHRLECYPEAPHGSTCGYW